jgi:hypothetical protein
MTTGNKDATDLRRKEPEKEIVPLGWTQIRRQGKKRKANTSSSADASFFCCDDQTCDENMSAATATSRPCKENTSIEGSVSLEGKALFCLHSLDCTWFQGQFVISGGSSIKPLGLLANQRDDLDECLQCSDGGYRELDMSIMLKPNKRGERKPICLKGLTCTGGDMMKISTPLEEGSDGKAKSRPICLSFDGYQIITGNRVIPLVQRYFASLLEPSKGGVLKQLPDCAIVVGDMRIRLPKSCLKMQGGDVVKGVGNVADDDDDDWLE